MNDIRIAGVIHDTEKLVRLIDPDRGKNQDILSARIDRKVPLGSPVSRLDYKLKHLAAQLLNLQMVGYDDKTPMDVMAYKHHVLYLTSDLLGTKALYDYLMARLTPSQRDYHGKYIVPLTPVLVAMSETGVRLNSKFVLTESHKLEGMLAAISEAHKRRHGHPLMGMNAAAKVSWLFGELGLVPDQFTKLTSAQLRRGDKRGDPSLSTDHLRVLAKTYAGHSRAVSSLTLVRRFQQVEYLLSGLDAVARYVDHRDGRVHTSLRDTLATGRISSSSPNLQGIAKRQVIAGVPVRCRNILIASEGFELVAFDIAQADIRVMENAVASFPCSSYEHLRKLREERLVQLGPHIGLHLAQLKAHRNPTYKLLGGTSEPGFFPSLPCALAGILRKESGDLYTEVARQVTGQKQVGKQDRNIFKTVTLSIANSITPTGLARRLGYSDDLEGRAKTKGHMEDFWRAYPQVASFTELMRWQVALTGQTETWAGRTRICTAHRWMTTLSRVEMLISFKGPEWLWLDVIPLRPGRNGLTVWIRKVWDATFRSSNLGRLIYEDVRGPLCTRPYRLFQTHSPLMFKLPIRNISWRSIRRVRTDSEEAIYHGFDSTARSLINHVYQGGTADVSKTMMLRALPYCRWIGARMLLQIHDELLFEVPKGQVSPFIRTMRRILELPPSPEFQIPIRVEAKRGLCFGQMTDPTWPPKLWVSNRSASGEGDI